MLIHLIIEITHINSIYIWTSLKPERAGLLAGHQQATKPSARINDIGSMRIAVGQQEEMRAANQITFCTTKQSTYKNTLSPKN